MRNSLPGSHTARREEVVAIVDYPIVIMLGAFSLLGVWAIVDPSGIIGWVKQARPELDDYDPSAHAVVRFIGAWFIILPAVIFVVSLLNRFHR